MGALINHFKRKYNGIKYISFEQQLAVFIRQSAYQREQLLIFGKKLLETPFCRIKAFGFNIAISFFEIFIYVQSAAYYNLFNIAR